MAWCPKCRKEYPEGVTECADCNEPLVEALPDEPDTAPQREAEADAEDAVQIANPIAVYAAEQRMDAEMIRDVLKDSGIAVEMRRVLMEQSGAVSGKRARYGFQLMVEAEETAHARQIIDELKQALEAEQLDEDELARLAEEQAMESPEQPMEDNTAFKMLPIVVAVVVVALALLYFVAR